MALPLPAPRPEELDPQVQRAAHALADGEPVLMYDLDGREEETDILVAAEHCTPETVHLLRRDGGGLVFLAVDGAIGARFGLPFAHDIESAAADVFPLLEHTGVNGLPYDSRSSFSLWVNHRDTFTGITDIDRSLTIRKIAETAEDAWNEDLTGDDARRLFGSRFRAPGHVSLCVGHPDGLAGRQGHTELATTLARIAGITPVVAGCEMLDGTTGKALRITDAEKYATRNGLVFLRGDLITEAHRQWRETTVIHGA